MRLLAFFLSTVLAISTVALPGAAHAASPTPELLAALDAAFAERDDPAKLRALEAQLDGELAKSPDAYELLWRAGRLKLWVAEGHPNKDQKKALAKAARTLTEKAAQLEPQRVEGLYYAAASVGIYSQSIGILKALGEGVEGKFNGYLDKALALNPDYEEGGPRIAKGRYHYELPWPKRSLKKSRQMLTEAVRRFPNKARARVYLAETLLADDEPALAAKELEALKALPVGSDAAEDRRMREWAQAVTKKVQDALD